MATTAATATATAVASPSTSSSSLLLPRRRFLRPASASARCRIHPPPRLRVARQVAVGSDVSSSSDVAAEETAAAGKVGKRVRVTAPVRVHHVAKVPGLELRGMEGVVKQYVGMWKGKRITANLPSRWSSSSSWTARYKPVRFIAHLREEEFEIVGDE
ncbi:hypothetical protein EJB05_38624, partial [Eragrostis curvula]